MKIQRFNNRAFLQAQVKDALESDLNHHGTRVEFSKPDHELKPSELLHHYIVSSDGAKHFAPKRRDFMELVEFEPEKFKLDFEI